LLHSPLGKIAKMSSSNDAVFLRRNNQIQDAIDSQNMKQALQLIEKRMKKGENTQFLKVSTYSSPVCLEISTAIMLSAIENQLTFHG
jgi:hypothetical protein